MNVLRRFLAARRLAKMVEAKRNDPKTLEFRKHREAAKLGWQRRRAAI